MLRASVISVGMLLAILTIPAGMGQVAPSELRDIVVDSKNCAPVPLSKEDDPEGIIDREIIKPSQQEIYRQWLPLIPPSARPPSSKKGAAVIKLKLSMDGKIQSLHLISRSGDEAIAKSAWGAITSSAFKSFPIKAKARSVTWTVFFTTNGEKCSEENEKSN